MPGYYPPDEEVHELSSHTSPTSPAMHIPTTYLREKLSALERALDLLEDTNTLRFQRLNLSTISLVAEAVTSEADKWIAETMRKEKES